LRIYGSDLEIKRNQGGKQFTQKYSGLPVLPGHLQMTKVGIELMRLVSEKRDEVLLRLIIED
jgi:hypothetical protein